MPTNSHGRPTGAHSAVVEYSDAEREWLIACERLVRRCRALGSMPNPRDILALARELGYVRLPKRLAKRWDAGDRDGVREDLG